MGVPAWKGPREQKHPPTVRRCREKRAECFFCAASRDHNNKPCNPRCPDAGPLRAHPATVTKLSSAGAILGTYPVGIAPIGLAIDASGNIWVANNYQGTVTKLNNTGGILGTFAVGSYPENIAIDSSGKVWVTAGGGITILNNTGSILSKFIFGIVGSHGIAIDSNGNFWVTRFNSNDNVNPGIVSKLNSSGNILANYTVGRFPLLVAVDDNDNIWVTNYGDNTVTKLAILATWSPSASPSKSPSISRPSKSPTSSPSSNRPSKSPTIRPSKIPSTSPTTARPSKSPSVSPTISPTLLLNSYDQSAF